MNEEQLQNLVQSLIALPGETEWAEFKLNNADPSEIGENISGLANAAALHNKERAFILWGIDDQKRTVAGTTFRPRQKRIGNEELENWLLKQLDPRIEIAIHEVNADLPVVLFIVQAANGRPVSFRGKEYIRVGSYTKSLRDFPEKERALWLRFERQPFEDGIAKENASDDQVLDLIDYPAFFRLIGLPLPDNRSAILERLNQENVIVPVPEGGYHVTNAGAILFARDLNGFGRLARKPLRVIIYRGSNRIRTVREQASVKGYAVGFEEAIEYIDQQLPANEQVGDAFRNEGRMYPRIAVRELVANALIHQDFSITGAGPMVEIFDGRLEISNPGKPLIDTLRFIDEPPQSRNEALARSMRRMSICEERGSGIDKVISSVELSQLPAPDFRVAGSSTVAVLYGPRTFNQMDREERVRACYQHACLLFVSGLTMTNATLRKRLGIDGSRYPTASRIIRDAINGKLIKPKGKSSELKKDASYVPFWA